MTQPLFGVYGASGCGRGIMPLAKHQVCQLGIDTERLVFIDDNPVANVVNGKRVLTYAEFLTIPATKRRVVITIADSVIREKLAERCLADGIQPWTVTAENVVIMDEVILGEGAAISPFVTLASNIRIGKYFHANLYSYIEHDSVIGDFVTFAPGAKCNGNIVIEDHAYIGSGAIIKQGRPGQPLIIGRGAIVGMGAVVIRDVAPGTVVVGNPARPLIKEKK